MPAQSLRCCNMFEKGFTAVVKTVKFFLLQSLNQDTNFWLPDALCFLILSEIAACPWSLNIWGLNFKIAA